MFALLFAGIIAVSLSAEPAPQAETLYARMGGYDGIARFVDTAFPRVATHPQLRRFFQGHSRDSQMRQRQRIVDILCAATDGPCLYTGAPMTSVHRGLGITADDWGVFMKIIREALYDLSVPDAAKRDFVDLLERRFRPDVVETETKENNR
jgi:hemoglobin